MKVGVAMVLNEQKIKNLVELQQAIISVYPLQPVLGTEFNLPHITLLQGRFGNHINWVSLISDLIYVGKNMVLVLEKPLYNI